MAKRQNDLTERTLAEKTDGVGDRVDPRELGKPARVTPARKPAKDARPVKHPTLAERNAPKASAPAPVVDPDAAMRAHAARLSTNLNAKSGHPTLAQRVAREGVQRAYGMSSGKKRGK